MTFRISLWKMEGGHLGPRTQFRPPHPAPPTCALRRARPARMRSLTAGRGKNTLPERREDGVDSPWPPQRAGRAVGGGASVAGGARPRPELRRAAGPGSSSSRPLRGEKWCGGRAEAADPEGRPRRSPGSAFSGWGAAPSLSFEPRFARLQVGVGRRRTRFPDSAPCAGETGGTWPVQS